MSGKSKNSFEVINDEIHIYGENWSRVGLTTYRKDYYDEICSKTWSLTNRKDLDKSYLKNSDLGLLHRYIMSKWYGKKILDEMSEKGYIVEHMNNKHMDCRISNLEFLKKAYNTAKAQTFDKDSVEMEKHIAVNIFKDFSTGCYQLTIGCNDSIIGFDTEGSKYYVVAILLLYDCDYSIVINDAENILRLYETEGRIDISKTYACDVKIRKAIDINLTEKEKNSAIVMRDGVSYLVLGTEKAYLNSVHYEKGWRPPKE
ncbi:MAG: hypothetical protein ACLR4C_05420 [Eubacterium ventriosum]|jgi:hypothetical protein|uniref:hypothetical protein n=1 Tax=Eubacterium ventriosum TaxID=39496 RepID=UPI00265F2FB2|nr:hypothetical protein [Eubacterium ventriosum]